MKEKVWNMSAGSFPGRGCGTYMPGFKTPMQMKEPQLVNWVNRLRLVDIEMILRDRFKQQIAITTADQYSKGWLLRRRAELHTAIKLEQVARRIGVSGVEPT